MLYRAMPTYAISDLRNRQAEVVGQLRTTPVQLMQRGDSTGILVNPRLWNYLVEVFEKAQAAGLLDIDPASIGDWVDEPEPTSIGAGAYVAQTDRP